MSRASLPTNQPIVNVYHQTYGCVKCQTYHFDCEPIYREHIDWQSKHGTRPTTEREHQIHFAGKPHESVLR